MKKLTYFFLFITVFSTAISCKKEDVKSSESKSLQSQLDRIINTPQTEENTITDMAKPFMTAIDTKKQNIINEMISEGIQPKLPGNSHTPGMTYGPFYKTGTLAMVAPNKKLFISNTDAPTLASGYYICDVYASNSGNVPIPTGAAFMVDFNLMPKYGYTNYAAGSPFTKGVNLTQSQTPQGSTYYMYTYSILIKYTVSGQAVNKTIPYDLTGMQFVYSYTL